MMEEEIAVQLKLPKSVYEFSCLMAGQEGLEIEAYLMQGIKDTLIGELVYLVELTHKDEDDMRDPLEKYVISRTGKPLTELSTAPRIAQELGMREFLVEPHHSSGWDDNVLDIPI